MTTYTIEHRGRCVLITGAVPLSAVSVLIQLAPKDAAMDADVARMLGATFAFGPVDELRALRASAAPAAEARERVRHPQLSAAAASWLASGERGISSNTIFTRLTGVNALGESRPSHPLDADDARRCCLLLGHVPELQPLFPRMAEASREWAALVADWPAITAAIGRGDVVGERVANRLVDTVLASVKRSAIPGTDA